MREIERGKFRELEREKGEKIREKEGTTGKWGGEQCTTRLY